MRRLLPIIAGLYPRPWRERYGEEFTALLEDVNPSARTALNVFKGAIAMQFRNWNYKWSVAIWAALAGAVFAAMLFAIPKTYVSKGTLILNGPTPLAQADLDSLGDIADQVKSPHDLATLLNSQNLYVHEISRMQRQDVLQLMKRNIAIQPVGGQGSSKTIEVRFDYSDPGIAQRVTQALMGNFVDRFYERSGHPDRLLILDPASLPPSPNVRGVAATSFLAGMLTLGLLRLFQRRALVDRQVKI